MGPLGYVYDPGRIADVVSERLERGDAVWVSSYSQTVNTQLAGSWARAKESGVRGIFLRDREIVVFGRYLRPHFQKRGTCVSRGMTRGLQTSLNVAIVDQLEVMKPVIVSFAPIYSTARNEIGHGRCGSDDGAILADAAKAVHDLGVASTDLFRDMTEDQIEAMACKYAAPGQRTPDQWLQAMKGHTAATFAPDSLSLLFDCIAAGYAVPYAHSYITGKPNKNGLSDLGAYGPHCRCFVGVYVDENGEDQLESSESWGRFPAGDPNVADQTMPVDQMPRVEIRYAGGTKLLAPGDVGVNAKRFWQQIQQSGEAWAVGAPKFAASTLSEVMPPYLGAV